MSYVTNRDYLVEEAAQAYQRAFNGKLPQFETYLDWTMWVQQQRETAKREAGTANAEAIKRTPFTPLFKQCNAGFPRLTGREGLPSAAREPPNPSGKPMSSAECRQAYSVDDHGDRGRCSRKTGWHLSGANACQTKAHGRNLGGANAFQTRDSGALPITPVTKFATPFGDSSGTCSKPLFLSTLSQNYT